LALAWFQLLTRTRKAFQWVLASAAQSTARLLSARMATILITRTRALPMATMGLAGSLAASSSAPAPGTVVATAADFMAGLGLGPLLVAAIALGIGHLLRADL
jgi:hypothetical protein